MEKELKGTEKEDQKIVDDPNVLSTSFEPADMDSLDQEPKAEEEPGEEATPAEEEKKEEPSEKETPGESEEPSEEEEPEKEKETQEAEKSKDAKDDLIPRAEAEKMAEEMAEKIGVKRIGKLTRKFRDAERENESLKAKVAELEKNAPELKEPKESDYETVGEFVKAMNNWQAAQRDRETRKAREEETTRRVQTEFREAKDAMIAEGMKKYKDFKETCLVPPTEEGGKTFTLPVVKIALQSKAPEDVIYHLGKTPDLLAELAEEEDPIQIALAIGRIETKIKTTKEEKKTPKAPPPLPLPRGGGPSTAGKSLESAKAGKEYRKMREGGARK